VDFVKVNVLNWKDQLALFKFAKAKYGHVDFVFANAGITENFNVFEDTLDEDGELAEPSSAVIDVNLKAVAFSE
jgi:NAD(P)-dependent dehydrogenase (short-subunit alcohol dehydrogenase family)